MGRREHASAEDPSPTQGRHQHVPRCGLRGRWTTREAEGGVLYSRFQRPPWRRNGSNHSLATALVAVDVLRRVPDAGPLRVERQRYPGAGSRGSLSVLKDQGGTDHRGSAYDQEFAAGRHSGRIDALPWVRRGRLGRNRRSGDQSRSLWRRHRRPRRPVPDAGSFRWPLDQRRQHGLQGRRSPDRPAAWTTTIRSAGRLCHPGSNAPCRRPEVPVCRCRRGSRRAWDRPWRPIWARFASMSAAPRTG